MKITTFNPQIVTKNAEPLVSLFEELGFKKRHEMENIGEKDFTGIRMKDENGFCIDIAQTDSELPVDRDIMAIRMNVDDFDEAYGLLLSRGFKNFYGDKIIETPVSKSAMMMSPTGLQINLIQHMKKGE